MLKVFLVCFLVFSGLSVATSDSFVPSHRLTGIGVARGELSSALLTERTRLMVESQTFYILRDPRSVQGAQRIEKLDSVFQDASRRSGLRPSLIKAIAYLESFGDPLAQSPTGPRGIMQVSGATAQVMGLRMIYTTKYRTSIERRSFKNRKGKVLYKTVKTKTPYQVLLRDERLVPERAIPAAAMYLARLQHDLGGLDWAVFAYHCGPGCVGNIQNIARSQDLPKPVDVPRMFFGANPVWNRDLYDVIRREMERDYSPTYYFRITRAEELLNLYREDKPTFLELANYYRFEPDPTQRAQHRLAVWLKAGDLLYQSCDDIRRDDSKRLARIFDDPEFFGFKVSKDRIGIFDLANQDYYLQATPSAIGTLTYIAFETRRLFQAMRPKGERYVPLEVTSLVRPMDSLGSSSGLNAGTGPTEGIAHCSGQVFDLRYDNLPPSEKEALDFVLDDLGYDGYLGYIDEAPNSGIMHIGCSPSSREFFSQIFQDAVQAKPVLAKR